MAGRSAKPSDLQQALAWALSMSSGCALVPHVCNWFANKHEGLAGAGAVPTLASEAIAAFAQRCAAIIMPLWIVPRCGRSRTVAMTITSTVSNAFIAAALGPLPRYPCGQRNHTGFQRLPRPGTVSALAPGPSRHRPTPLQLHTALG